LTPLQPPSPDLAPTRPPFHAGACILPHRCFLSCRTSPPSLAHPNPLPPVQPMEHSQQQNAHHTTPRPIRIHPDLTLTLLYYFRPFPLGSPWHGLRLCCRFTLESFACPPHTQPRGFLFVAPSPVARRPSRPALYVPSSLRWQRASAPAPPPTTPPHPPPPPLPLPPGAPLIPLPQDTST
jgi:hypothetical protein